MAQPSHPYETVTTMPVLPPRPVDSNKGSFGRVLVVAGSRGMSGAAVLCAGAALRGGAGLVYLAVPEGIQDRVATANPCYLTIALPQDDRGQVAGRAEAELLPLLQANDVVALGPGLGRSRELTTLVTTVLAQARVPLVLDADGLNALEHHSAELRRHAGPVVITPHPGEFARLAGCQVADVQARRQERAARFAAEHGVIVILKGYGTVVTDGRRVYVNTTGNPGMATGGTGDVLTGLIAALLGQGLEPFAAAQLGVHVHGLAGDLARDELGEVSLIASDLVEFLPHAFRNL
ncbi:MAG TPA: NAD(P)H-hydrate dehydratase [Gemmataceae bacterium]|nr:NAD(P)H-hydrate dehydratase [Gemmataceae bacterium]